MEQTHLGKCLSTTSMQQPRILRLLSLVGTVAMVQYLFNLWNLKLILTRTLISSLVQTPMSESYYSRSRSRCPASCPRVIAWFSCMVTLRFGSRSFVVASTVEAIQCKFHSFLLYFCQRLSRTRSRYVLYRSPHLVPKPVENDCLENSYFLQTSILHDRLAKWLRRLSYISYVGVSQKVAGSIPASIIDFLRFGFAADVV